ncbi:MAG: ABC transporter ATP-binding protein [Melioribacteraceae bacterium]|nr:ABC transporter ATP-binding protein [Melioribacteraceae bacterium]
MIKFEHIVKRFNGITALNDISVSIDKGDFFGLLGPNGAGKTTLMNIIVGYLSPDTGKVLFENNVLSQNKLGVRRKIGYVPQEISLYQELSAYQNLKIFGSFFGLSKNELTKNIERALELVQLKERKNDTVKNFSGGMKRRLNIAASILHDPILLLCDEPTVGVDPQSRNAIFDMLQHLNDTGITIIYTTHYMEEAERLCSRMAIIDYGKIISIGTLPDLINLLDKKESVKIKKHPGLQEKLEEISKLGSMFERELQFELLPDSRFTKNSTLFEALESLEIASEYIQLSRASLEDVFLHLTGRSLRD